MVVLMAHMVVFFKLGGRGSWEACCMCCWWLGSCRCVRMGGCFNCQGFCFVKFHVSLVLWLMVYGSVVGHFAWGGHLFFNCWSVGVLKSSVCVCALGGGHGFSFFVGLVVLWRWGRLAYWLFVGVFEGQFSSLLG